MYRSLAAVLAATVLASAPPAVGQTVTARVDPTFQNGTLAGCSLVFDVVFKDYAYRQDQMMMASGSLNIMAFPQGIGVMLKLGIAPNEPTDSPYVPPTTAYLVHGFQTNAGDATGQADAEMPGFRLFAFAPNDDTLVPMVEIETKRRLVVGYTLGSGQTAATVDVDVATDQAQRWRECEDALLATAR